MTRLKEGNKLTHFFKRVLGRRAREDSRDNIVKFRTKFDDFYNEWKRRFLSELQNQKGKRTEDDEHIVNKFVEDVYFIPEIITEGKYSIAEIMQTRNENKFCKFIDEIDGQLHFQNYDVFMQGFEKDQIYPDKFQTKNDREIFRDVVKMKEEYLKIRALIVSLMKMPRGEWYSYFEKKKGFSDLLVFLALYTKIISPNTVVDSKISTLENAILALLKREERRETYLHQFLIVELYEIIRRSGLKR